MFQIKYLFFNTINLDYLFTEINKMECPVCCETFSPTKHKPKIINPCGHSICSLCETKLSKKCPICRCAIISSIINFGLIEYLTTSKEQSALSSANDANTSIHETKDECRGGMTQDQTNAFNFLKNSIELLHSSKQLNQRTYATCEHDLVPYEMYRNSIALCGRGGVGKTYVLSRLINELITDKNFRICFTSTTHNAINIMKQILNKTTYSSNLLITTLARFVRRNVWSNSTLCLATIQDYIKSQSKLEFVGHFDLIIIDESSMIRVDDLNDIVLRVSQEKEHGLTESDHFPLFLFVGDYRQIGPIGEVMFPDNYWSNIVSHVLFSNKEKCFELTTIVRTLNTTLQEVCDSVGNELEAYFHNRSYSLSMSSFETKLMKSSSSSSVHTMHCQQAIEAYSDKLTTSHPNSIFWIHYNNLSHHNTLDLTRRIRHDYFNKLYTNYRVDDTQYIVGEFFSFNKNFFCSVDDITSLAQDRLCNNPFFRETISSSDSSVITSLSQTEFLNDTFHDQFKLLNKFERLNFKNAIQNERFKILHLKSRAMKLFNFFQQFDFFAENDFKQSCKTKEIAINTLFLASSFQPAHCFLLDHILNLSISYGDYCGTSKTQENFGIFHNNENILSITSCSYAKYKEKYLNILKLFDFQHIFPVTYVNSIQTSQGSTIDTVFVSKLNIFSAKNLSSMQMFSQLYTAMTRAKREIYIVV